MKSLFASLATVSATSLIATLAPVADASVSAPSRPAASSAAAAGPKSARPESLAADPRRPFASEHAEHEAATARAEQRRVTDYWTPARMRDAKPVQVSLEVPASASPQPAPASATSAGEYWGARGGDVVRTTGKVFFSDSGGDYVCSAGVVEGVSRSLVITAGHCVFNLGEWARNWQFVPGYDRGNAPYGEWPANNLYTTTEWHRRESLRSPGDVQNFRYDVGMARLNVNSVGKTVSDVVGSQPIIFNRQFVAQRYVFGYPAARPYNGERLVFCSGKTAGDPWMSTDAHSLACNLRPGASGGPWFIGFDEATGRGLVNSVSSYYYPGTNRFFGPYFGKAIQAFYASVQPLPRNGSFIAVRETNRVYRIVGGAPIPVLDWSAYGGPKPVSWVTSRYLSRLRVHPADATFVQAIPSGTVYRMAYGAPITVTSWAPFGGPKPVTQVDARNIDRNLGFRRYADTGFLQGAPEGTIYRVVAGHPYVVRSWTPFGGRKPTVRVQRASILACDHLDCSPFGRLDSVRPAAGGFRLVGWAMDGNVGGAIDVTVSVDGKPRLTLLANVSRPDLGAAYHRGLRFGFDTSVRVQPGQHQICVTAENEGLGTDRRLGCRIVTR